MRKLGLLAALCLAACSDAPTAATSASSGSGSATSASSNGGGASSGSGTSSSSAAGTSSAASSSSASSASSSTGAGGSTGGSLASSSSSGGTSGTGSDSGSDSGSSGGTSDEPDAGPPDAGPADAGVYVFEPGPNTYWCRVYQSGTLVELTADDAGCTPAMPACVGEAVPLEPEVHVPEPMRVAYLTEPVPAGPHWPCWASWGVAHAHSALPTERWLHNSEHGGIVLLYRCDPDAGLPDGGDCDAMAAPLVDYARDGGPLTPDGDARYLVTARPELPTAYAAIAWGWRLELSAWDPTQVTCFALAHLEAGPENIAASPDPTGCPQSYLP